MVVGPGLKPRPGRMPAHPATPSPIPSWAPWLPQHQLLCHFAPLVWRKGCHGEHLAGKAEGGASPAAKGGFLSLQPLTPRCCFHRNARPIVLSLPAAFPKSLSSQFPCLADLDSHCCCPRRVCTWCPGASQAHATAPWGSSSPEPPTHRHVRKAPGMPGRVPLFLLYPLEETQTGHTQRSRCPPGWVSSSRGPEIQVANETFPLPAAGFPHRQRREARVLPLKALLLASSLPKV